MTLTQTKVHFQNKVIFLKQDFFSDFMLFFSARKSFLWLPEKATVEGHKPDFRTCVINNTAAFSTRSSCQMHKPPGLLSKLSVLGYFVATVVKDIVNTWRLVLASIHSQLKQSKKKKNQSWRKHEKDCNAKASTHVWFCFFVAIKTSWVCLERSEWTRVWLPLISCTSEKKVEIHQMFCSWVDLVVKIQTASVTAEHF